MPDAGASDDAGPPDASPDAASGTIGFGEACRNDAECESGICLLAGGAARCTRECADDCPMGYDCSEITSGGGEVRSICVPTEP